MSSNTDPSREDRTSHPVKPDFDSGKGYFWMKQMYNIRKAKERGEYVPDWPTKPRRGKAETSFFKQVDRQLSRSSFTISVKFDKDGRLIKDEL